MTAKEEGKRYKRNAQKNRKCKTKDSRNKKDESKKHKRNVKKSRKCNVKEAGNKKADGRIYDSGKG